MSCVTHRAFVCYVLALFAIVLAGGSLPRQAAAQSDVVDSARALCDQAVAIWDSHDQWAIGQLSLIYHELSTQISAEEFDVAIRSMYRGWTPSFGVERPCDPDVLTHAARPNITRTQWETFTRCLQSGIDARKSTVETYVREHQNLAVNTAVGTINLTMADASRDYLTSLARAAGLRMCRP